MQEYYNNETARTEDFEKDNDELNAKKAREMTNAAIINLIKKEVFPKIAEKANRGECKYSFAMSRKIDYKVGIEYLKKLGYNLSCEFDTSDSLTIYLKW